MNTTTETRRLFVRQIPSQLADLPTGPSTTPSLPDALRQEHFYTDALAQMEQVIPLQVATLRDQLDRVKATLERFQMVRMEELTWLQLTNEDVYRADEIVTEKIAALRQKRDELEVEHEARIESRMQQRALARQVAVATFAAAGMDESKLKTEFADQDESMILPMVEPSAPTGNQEALAGIASSSAPQKTGFLQRLLRGRLSLPTATHGEDQITSPAPSQANIQNDTMPHRLVPEVALDEAELLAKPREALCLQQGLPTASPTLKGLNGNQPWLEWAALMVCGTIFGISVGILIEVLDPTRLFNRPEETWLPALIVGVIGIAVFWVLGRVAHGLMSLASECWHASVAAHSRIDKEAVARSLRCASGWSMVIGALLLIGLIIIEASVERYGILGTLASREVNSQIQNGIVIGSTKVSPLVQMAMALIVSLPFLLLHGLHGWVEGKAGAINGFLEHQATESRWETKKALHDQRTTELTEINSDLLKYRREELARMAQSGLPRETSQQGMPLIEGGATVMAATSTPQYLIPDGAMLRLSAEQGWPLGSAAAAVLAMAQAQEAHFQVRRAQAQKRDTLAPLDQEIQHLETLRLAEKQELSSESKQRIDSAHTAYVTAVREFDTLYKQEWQRYETLTQPGLFWRLRQYFWATPTHINHAR